MFSNLSERLQNTFKKLRGKGKLSENDVDAALREVRLALLEADVNYRVVKDFVNRLKERCVGREVLESLTPAQQVIKIVHQEMIGLLGGSESKISFSSHPPTVIMMTGLQGSGKTTTAAKLASLLRRQGHRPLLVAADVYRPAAIKQLQVLGTQLELPVFAMGESSDPVDICAAAVAHSNSHGNDVVILDTAGRLHVDREMMNELENIRTRVSPDEILLVVDAMTGQDAVNVASSFNEVLRLSGIVLTKLDGDARGGSALSMKAVTGTAIKFVGTGEKLDALEIFYPDRLVSRILGMGDVLSLIEKAEQNLDTEKAKRLSQKLMTDGFTLEDFLDQMQEVKKMGSLDQILGMLPGFAGGKALKGLQVDERELVKIEAIINSMTIRERRNPSVIDGSRRRRIAAGSGTRVQDVNRLLKQFDQTRELMKRFGPGKKLGKKAKGLMSFFR